MIIKHFGIVITKMEELILALFLEYYGRIIRKIVRARKQ